MISTGIFDKNNIEICKGDTVQFMYYDLKKIEDHKNNPKYSGEIATCKIDFQFGMFGLLWSDGYFNKWPLNGHKLEIIPETK